MSKKVQKLNQKQLNILYECWKDANNNKEKILLLEKNLPNIHPIFALSLMRKLEKTEKKWLQMTTRKKNQKNKEKEEEQKKKELKRLEREKNKKLKEEKKKDILKKKDDKKIREKISNELIENHFEDLKNKIDSQFFFCPTIQQYSNHSLCIFRIFKSGVNTTCDKCKKMDKYIPAILEVINDRK